MEEVGLVGMERGNSPFETEIRKLRIPACRHFLQAGALAPLSFTPEGTELLAEEKHIILDAFPRLYALNQNRVLAPHKSMPLPSLRKRVAVLFSGGPAAGGHNVLLGIKRLFGNDHTLLGVRAGPGGFLKADLFEIPDTIERLANTGGFDYLGTDRTRIRSAEQLERAKQVCVAHNLDAIIIIGGDDSNTNAAYLAEHLFGGVHADGSGVQVISVPKTMDGDLQVGSLLPISFGFDTATRVYAELVGNILQDTPSSRKYWHFVRLMGRTASNVTLEVALQTKPHVALIAEEAAAQQQTLQQIVDGIARVVLDRASRDIHYGVVLVPEGLLEFLPQVGEMITEIDAIIGMKHEMIAPMSRSARRELITNTLSQEHSALFATLPGYVQDMLVADRDAHGNLKVSQLETERLVAELVARRVKELAPDEQFLTNTHFFGYEGRCGAPTLFDATLCYNLGLTAASLVLDDRTGYMASITDLENGGRPVAIPLTGILHREQREGQEELVIEKALVKLDSPAFRFFASRRDEWAREDRFASPGPRQLWGPAANQLPITVVLNQGYTRLQFRL